MKPLLVTVAIIGIATLIWLLSPMLGISTGLVVLAGFCGAVALMLYVAGII
ncbi:hypothetical protein [Ralstonia mannitolilytica]|uniref:hypothetical protein n=1 Tax=Ralstonia mannitolilytica TaxID=105219 RepID=UPI0037488266